MSKQDTRVVFLKGPRVEMRPIMNDDIPLLTKWINDPEIRDFVQSYVPMSDADEASWVNSLSQNKSTTICFVIVVDGKLIGSMGLQEINFKDRVALTGALIGEKKYWGKGYGTEAKMLLLDYAFNTLNLRKICSNVIAYNKRSFNYSLTCGYHEEGRRKQQHYRKGRYWDEIQLAVFKRDWKPLWKKFLKQMKK
jgi:RimJ/RimL family protein N-acetyltransferase